MLLNPTGLAISCAYYADGGSQGKPCNANNNGCTPGCARWCNPSRGIFNWGCAWRGSQLKLMLEQQIAVHPNGGYNEIVVNAQSWVDKLPGTIVAIFVCVNEEGEADHNKLESARSVQRKFAGEYGIELRDFPLLMFDERNGEEPFRVMPDDYRTARVDPMWTRTP